MCFSSPPPQLFSALLEIQRVGCEHLFGSDPGGDDLLAVGVLDECLEGRTVRFKAKGQGVTTTDQLLVF